jgi:Domain of unknown function (DUF4157)
MSARMPLQVKPVPQRIMMPGPAGFLQRKCACGGTPGVDGECAACRAKRLARQRQGTGAVQPDQASASVQHAGAVVGRSLEAGTRASMEGHFGHDFSRVRIHTDSTSARAARSLDAHAYTVGQNIYFASGRYDPASPAGKGLLAHELTHTIQQRHASTVVQAAYAMDSPDTAPEREAEAAALAVVSGTRPRISGSVPYLAPQRQAADPSRQSVSLTVPGGHVDVERTLEERPCTRMPEGRFAPGDVIYFDSNANAVGIRFQYCRGTGQVEVDSSINYGRLRSDAEGLLRQLPGTISGGDFITQLRNTVEQTNLGARTSVAVTVSGILRAEVRGSTDQGLQSRQYDVQGLLRLTPHGWSLELGAEYRHIANESGGTNDTITFTPRVNIGPVQGSVTVEHAEGRVGTPTNTTTLRGQVSVRTGGSTGITLSGSSERGGSFFITFGTITPQTIPQVPRVDCHVCDCPPPIPHYHCVTVHDAHPESVVTQTAGHEMVELHYQYDKAIPEDADMYHQRINSIAGLVSSHYAIQSIRGFASPEASVPYNRVLARRRASQASGDIAAALSALTPPVTASIPRADGEGELLGEGAAGREASNANLIATLSARLRGLDEQQQLDLLGIDAATLSAATREDVRRRIDAFIQGVDQGRRLTQRARWEKIFPFLRRVEVTLDRPQLSENRMIPETRTPGDCDADTLARAQRSMPPVPPGRRVPTSRGVC